MPGIRQGKAIIIRSGHNLRVMRKSIILSLLIVGIVAVLVAGCTNIPGSTNNASLPTPQIDYVAVNVSQTPTSAETSTRDVVTAAPTLSTACGDLISASGDDQAFLNFLNDNTIVTRINGLASGDCSKIPAEQITQLITTGAIPQTSSLAQARMYLISATKYCQNPDSAAPNNTETDLGKFENGINQYQNLVYSCQDQISANASSVAGGEKLVMNNIEGPQTFSGSGNSVKEFTVTEGGYSFAATYAGYDNFIVHITNNYGKPIDELFNETGPYSGGTSVNLPAGKFYMSIEASAPYLIKMTQS
ncbi:MAG: hypothetical protein WCE46_02585 [Methanoregula sp.]|uniref:hypothetical protein n=1 Tax=Methanoregula sp. TaxID=2052170 RepID=UPI003C75E212